MDAPSLADFKVVAKIDFITITSDDLPGRGDAKLIQALQEYFDGTVNLPARNKQWLTVQDPTRHDLQQLIDACHRATIETLEIAVDFVPKAFASADRLAPLYRWLRHSLAPQRHEWMHDLARKQYSEQAGKRITLRSLEPLNEDTTFYWSAKSAYFQLRLYIKTHDRARRTLLQQPVVRVEVTLNRGGTQLAQVPHVGLLPDFLPLLRRYLSPFFSVGKGIKTQPTARLDRLKASALRQAVIEKEGKRKVRAARQWERYGSAYAIKRGLDVIPDRDVNRVVETSLKRLAERLTGLRAPEKVADFPAWLKHQQQIDKGFFGARPRSYRSNKKLS